MTRLLLCIASSLLLVPFQALGEMPERRDINDVSLLSLYALQEKFIHAEDPVIDGENATVKAKVGDVPCIVTLGRFRPSSKEASFGWEVRQVKCGAPDQAPKKNKRGA